MNIIICPSCGLELKQIPKSGGCPNCGYGRGYKLIIKNGKLYKTDKELQKKILYNPDWWE